MSSVKRSRLDIPQIDLPAAPPGSGHVLPPFAYVFEREADALLEDRKSHCLARRASLYAPLYDLLSSFPSELVRLVLEYDIDLFRFHVRLSHRTPIVAQDKKEPTRVVDEKANKVLMGFPPENVACERKGAFLEWYDGAVGTNSVKCKRIRLFPDAPPSLFPVCDAFGYGPRFAAGDSVFFCDDRVARPHACTDALLFDAKGSIVARRELDWKSRLLPVSSDNCYGWKVVPNNLLLICDLPTGLREECAVPFYHTFASDAIRAVYPCFVCDTHIVGYTWSESYRHDAEGQDTGHLRLCFFNRRVVGAIWQQTDIEVEVCAEPFYREDLSFHVLPGDRLLLTHKRGLAVLSAATERLATGTALLASTDFSLRYERADGGTTYARPTFGQMLDDHRMLIVYESTFTDERRPQHISQMRAIAVDVDTLLFESQLQFYFPKGKMAQVTHCFYSMGRFWIITRNPSAIECYTITESDLKRV